MSPVARANPRLRASYIPRSLATASCAVECLLTQSSSSGPLPPSWIRCSSSTAWSATDRTQRFSQASCRKLAVTTEKRINDRQLTPGKEQGEASANPLPLARNERQPRPPPIDLSVLIRNPELRSRPRRGISHQLHDLCPFFRRRRCRLEVPFQVRLLEGLQFGRVHLQAVQLTQCSPRFRREESMMAVVPKLFHLMQPLLGFRRIVRNTSVDQQEPAAITEDARRLPHKFLGRREMVRRHPARHQVERGV